MRVCAFRINDRVVVVVDLVVYILYSRQIMATLCISDINFVIILIKKLLIKQPVLIIFNLKVYF